MGCGERSADEGAAHTTASRDHRGAPRGRPALKIRRLRPNNRKKSFEIEAGPRRLAFPYALLRLRPTSENPIRDAFPDQELGCEGFTYRLDDGAEDTIHMDAVLDYNRDPAYLAELFLHRLTPEARAAAEESGLSKRELIRRLGTSPAQLYRLLDPANSAKSVGQMLALLHLLGRDVELVVTPSPAR